MKSRNPVIQFDDLQIYFAEPYVIDLASANGKIVMKQPTIGNLINLGYDKFFRSILMLTANTTLYRLQLWDSGKDWNEFSDFNLFLVLYRDVDKDVSDAVFGNIDLTLFQPYIKQVDSGEQIILYNPETEVEINEEVYFHISLYLRKVFDIKAEEKLTNDSIMKKWFIEKDRRQLAIDAEKAKKGIVKTSSILPMISSCVNHPGFKYNFEEMKNLTVGLFYDSVRRLQIYESSTALLKGMYSGFIDGKKIKPDDYNFMKSI